MTRNNTNNGAPGNPRKTGKKLKELSFLTPNNGLQRSTSATL